MMALLILALLAVLATNVVAQLETGCRPSLGQQPFPKPVSQQPQLVPKQPQEPFHPLLRQQLDPCKVFIQQLCTPVTAPLFLESQVLPQSSCQVRRQQCCQQLTLIPMPSRCQAICGLLHTIIIGKQQQPPQLDQGSRQPQQEQLGQFEAAMSTALQTLPTMCDVPVTPCCTVATSTGIATGGGIDES